jgi:hypothetical protein
MSTTIKDGQVIRISMLIIITIMIIKVTPKTQKTSKPRADTCKRHKITEACKRRWITRDGGPGVIDFLYLALGAGGADLLALLVLDILRVVLIVARLLTMRLRVKETVMMTRDRELVKKYDDRW